MQNTMSRAEVETIKGYLEGKNGTTIDFKLLLSQEDAIALANTALLYFEALNNG